MSVLKDRAAARCRPRMDDGRWRTRDPWTRSKAAVQAGFAINFLPPSTRARPHANSPRDVCATHATRAGHRMSLSMSQHRSDMPIPHQHTAREPHIHDHKSPKKSVHRGHESPSHPCGAGPASLGLSACSPGLAADRGHHMRADGGRELVEHEAARGGAAPRGKRGRVGHVGPGAPRLRQRRPRRGRLPRDRAAASSLNNPHLPRAARQKL